MPNCSFWDMKIRTATPIDIPAMAELLHQLFAIEADFTPNFPLQAKGLDLLLTKGNGAIFVAEHNGQVVGMCTVQLRISTAMGCEVGIVEDLVVDIEYRSRGFGSALLGKLEEWAVERGLPRLQLQADRDNHSALGFYRSHGWRNTNLIGWMKEL